VTPEQAGDWHILRARAAVLRAEIRLAGMRAENVQRYHSGESPAFVQEHFDEIIIEEGIGQNDMITRFQEAQ